MIHEPRGDAESEDAMHSTVVEARESDHCMNADAL